MAKLFKFEVVTPNRIFHSDEVELIVFETEVGQMGVMADHVPMLVANKMCTLKIQKNKETKYAFISEGFMEISSTKVSAVVDDAEWCDEIDIEDAINVKKKAEEELMNKKGDLSMKAELKASIERSAARIKTGRMIK